VREQELFDYLKESRFPDLVRSESTFDSFDCISEEHALYIELKCRHTHYPELLIEKSKYDRLILEAKFREMEPWYINSTPAGKWGFDLFKVPEPFWEERWMPTTTEFKDTRKKIKVVGFLHTDYSLPM
jgi:hypothetical protein